MSSEKTTFGLNETAFEALFKEYFVGLTAFAKKYVHDVDTSKEIVHDVFVNLWNKRKDIDPSKSLKSYLFTSVHNRCLNHIRDSKKFNQSAEVEEVENQHFTTEDNHLLEAAELEQRIFNLLNALPDKCREVFKLSRFEGKKYKEIADIMGISQKTVEVHMSKALKALRNGLQDYLTLIVLGIINFFLMK